MPKPGSALGDTTLAAQMSFIDGGLTQGQVAAVPGWGSNQAMKASGAEWTLTGADVSGVFGVEVEVQGMCYTLKLQKCGILSINIEDEVDRQFFIPFARFGMISNYGRDDYVRLGYIQIPLKSDSPLAIWEAAITVRIEGAAPANIISAVTNTTSVPAYRVWDITGADNGYGVARYWYSCEHFPDAAATRYSLLIFSARLAREFNLTINDKTIPLHSNNAYWVTRLTAAVKPVQANRLIFLLKNPIFRNKPALTGIPVWIGEIRQDFTSVTPPPIRSLLSMPMEESYSPCRQPAGRQVIHILVSSIRTVPGLDVLR